jgi:hypothetical protein
VAQHIVLTHRHPLNPIYYRLVRTYHSLADARRAGRKQHCGSAFTFDSRCDVSLSKRDHTARPRFVNIDNFQPAVPPWLNISDCGANSRHCERIHHSLPRLIRVDRNNRSASSQDAYHGNDIIGAHIAEQRDSSLDAETTTRQLDRYRS